MWFSGLGLFFSGYGVCIFWTCFDFSGHDVHVDGPGLFFLDEVCNFGLLKFWPDFWIRYVCYKSVINLL